MPAAEAEAAEAAEAAAGAPRGRAGGWAWRSALSLPLSCTAWGGKGGGERGLLRCVCGSGGKGGGEVPYGGGERTRARGKRGRCGGAAAAAAARQREERRAAAAEDFGGKGAPVGGGGGAREPGARPNPEPSALAERAEPSLVWFGSPFPTDRQTDRPDSPFLSLPLPLPFLPPSFPLRFPLRAQKHSDARAGAGGTHPHGQFRAVFPTDRLLTTR